MQSCYLHPIGTPTNLPLSHPPLSHPFAHAEPISKGHCWNEHNEAGVIGVTGQERVKHTIDLQHCQNFQKVLNFTAIIWRGLSPMMVSLLI